MAVLLVTAQPAGRGWHAEGLSNDWRGCEELVAAPGSGKYLVLHSFSISSNVATNVTLGAGETAEAVTTVLVGPIYLAINSAVQHVFRTPIKLAANTALVADAADSGLVSIVVEGETV